MFKYSHKILLLCAFATSIGFTTLAFHVYFKIVDESLATYWTMSKSELLWLWAGVMTSVSFLQALYSYGILLGSVHASKTIHSMLIAKFEHWIIAQVEKMTTGNILNLFSNDFNIMDVVIGFSLLSILPMIETLVWSFILFSIVSVYFIAIGITAALIFIFYMVILIVWCDLGLINGFIICLFFFHFFLYNS